MKWEAILATLNKMQIYEALVGTMGTDGWQRVIKPALKNRITELTVILVEGSQKDKDGVEHRLSTEEVEGIRQLIKTLNWVLSWEMQLERLSREIAATLEAQPPRRQPAVGSIYDFEEESN